MNFTIKQKLISIIVLVTLGLITLYVESTFNQNYIALLNQTKSNLKEVQISMLQLRRNEKDFLLRQDKKYLDTFASNLETTQIAISKLKSSMSEASIPVGKVDKIVSLLNQYNQHFSTLVTLSIERGLSQTEGNYGQLREATHQLEERINQSSDMNAQLQLLTVRRHEKDFLLRIEQKYIERLKDSTTDLSSHLSDAESIRLLGIYLEQFNSLVEATTQIGFDSKSGIKGEMREAVREMEGLLASEVKRLNKFISDYIESAQLKHLIIVIILSLVIGVVVAIVAKQIITPLLNFSVRISQIRQDNDLSQRCEERHDEIGAISKEFNIFMAHFQSLIKNINETVDSLTSSTNVVSKSVEKTSEGLVNQASESDMVATAVTEMGITASEIANNAHATKEKTDEASHKAGEGKTKLDGTVLNINELSEELVVAEKEILNLEEKSNGITSVLEVIKGIAEQTNLLALNAAIEAARAGEQGRGFAVVADEVRTLAVRTQDSTSEITAIINELQTTTSGIVKTVNQCKEQGLSSVAQAKETESVLNEIISDVEAIADMTVQVATAVEEQSVVVQDVDMNIVRIRDIGEQVADDSKENAKASQDVANLAAELHQEASIFNV